MPRKRRLAYSTGSVNEDLLCRIEYPLEENRVLRNQIQKRILLTNHERRTLAERAIARRAEFVRRSQMSILTPRVVTAANPTRRLTIFFCQPLL